MRKPCVLVSGPSVSSDKDLILSLKKTTIVLTNSDNGLIKFLFEDYNVDIIVLELLDKKTKELEILESIKTRFPSVKIILINGDREIFVKAFSLGVRDAFRKPYRVRMLIERINALLE